MQIFELDNGTIINLDHVVEIPKNEALTVEVRMSSGYISHISADEAMRMRRWMTHLSDVDDVAKNTIAQCCSRIMEYLAYDQR